MDTSDLEYQPQSSAPRIVWIRSHWGLCFSDLIELFNRWPRLECRLCTLHLWDSHSTSLSALRKRIPHALRLVEVDSHTENRRIVEQPINSGIDGGMVMDFAQRNLTSAKMVYILKGS